MIAKILSFRFLDGNTNSERVYIGNLRYSLLFDCDLKVQISIDKYTKLIEIKNSNGLLVVDFGCASKIKYKYSSKIMKILPKKRYDDQTDFYLKLLNSDYSQAACLSYCHHWLITLIYIHQCS